MKDPYEAQGKNFRVHHPVQPKTQVERWRDEIRENEIVMSQCTKEGELEDCEDCYKRWLKIHELYDLISQATQPIHPRYPTGTFADDEKTQVLIDGKWEKATPEPYHGIMYDLVTLLDKIKKILQ